MTLCNPITYCKTRYARVYLKNRHFSFFWRISRQLLVQKILGILQLLLEIVTRHGLCATLSSIVFVKSGWDNFAGRRSRLSGLFCNSDKDRIERRWVSANLSPQFHKWPNFCEELHFFSLPSNLKQTLGRQTTPPDFLLILASNHLWEWNTNRPTNSHRSDPSDGTGNGKRGDIWSIYNRLTHVLLSICFLLFVLACLFAIITCVRNIQLIAAY